MSFKVPVLLALAVVITIALVGAFNSCPNDPCSRPGNFALASFV